MCRQSDNKTSGALINIQSEFCRMKYVVMILILLGFVGMAHASQDDATHSTTMSFEEHYEIEILGLEDEYSTDEEYSFYFVISGYGYGCAGYQASYPDENGLLIGMGAEPLCDPETSMHEFEIKSPDRHGTLGDIVIKKPGTYAVTVTFEKPSKYFPTTVSKEFRVAEPADEKPNEMTPLKQFKSGVTVDEIQCRESLILVVKHDGSPACVKSDTASTLSQRQWGMPHESLVRLVESSDAIITGMVVGEDNRPNNERHVWLGSYEWLKQGKYDDQQLFLEQTMTHSGNGFYVPFERGEEVLLFLKSVDVRRGAYDLVDSEIVPAQKHSIKLRDAVAAFFDHEFFDQNVSNDKANEDNCSEKFLADDSYYYCTTKSESYVPVEKLTEKIKEKMLEKISPQYFEEHFDLTIVSDEPDVIAEYEPNSGPHTPPAKASGQNIEFVFTIDDVDFNYFMRTAFDKKQNQMFLHYHPPSEIKSIVSTEDEIDKLIYSCLEKEMYKFPYKPFHVAYHVEDGLSPVIEGHGPPTVHDRLGDAPVQDREKIFRVWLATGKVDCAGVHQEFDPENKKRPEKIVLFDSAQLEKLD